ncbi:MAG: hypothetical protein GT589_03090 [Peptoclostridium sp.]|uniref:flagellar hook-length control protein FliK n=1 Tax=Peptoclostridium sp. TaxID=1904860 RepID=UPI00139AF036|nr:flagellar hook-length control protein FliK [Peptoclostridium sp.]MZQ75126.1 hypothetical protein [Peptoclostridium sp.]
MNKLSVLPANMKEDFKVKDISSKGKSVARDEFAGTLEKMKFQAVKKRESEYAKRDDLRAEKSGISEKEDNAAVTDSDKKALSIQSDTVSNQNINNDKENETGQFLAENEATKLAGAESVLIDKSLINELKELAVQSETKAQAAGNTSDTIASYAQASDAGTEIQIEASIGAGGAIVDEMVQAKASKEIPETSVQNLQNTDGEYKAVNDAMTASIPDSIKLQDKGGKKKDIKITDLQNELHKEKPDDILGQSIKKLIAERNTAGQRFSGEEIKDTLETIKDEIIKLSEESGDFKFPGLSAEASSSRTNIELMKARPVYYSQREVVDQVINKIKITDADNLKSIEIKLEPEQLGKLTLKVVMENGVLTAKLIAESEKVKTAIESNISELKDSMLEQGINITAVDVSVDSEAQGEQGNQDGFEAALRSRRISSAIFNDILEDKAIKSEIDANNPYIDTEEINYLA